MIKPQGWINLYKPKNISSFKAINQIKKKFSIDKIGHAGTLDPMATGVLPIAIGKTTKIIPFINDETKIYNFSISWGAQTDTDDQEGEIINTSNFIPKKELIIQKIKLFLGTIKQKPPKVSAVKVGGIRAYKLSRDKINFNLNYKDVYIKELNIIEHCGQFTKFQIECGKGFYVRSLARDLSLELGTFGHISSLERVKVGKFNKESSILLDDLLKISQRLSNINFILPSISMLDDILAYEIEDKNDLIDISLGRSIIINEKKLKKIFRLKNLDKKIVFLSKNGDIVSFGKLVGNLFKPNKVLI